jgi:hypothetical protein
VSDGRSHLFPPVGLSGLEGGGSDEVMEMWKSRQ